jgi:CSLREA domain-containing protein
MINKSQSLFASLFLPFVALGTLFLVFVLYLPTQAKSGTYVVNTTEDTDDGSCDAAHCTLREAILAANASAEADTITFSLSPSATIILNDAQLPVISGTLTVDGSTATNLTISGDEHSRVLEVRSGAVVTITTLTISEGVWETGGGIYNEGGTLYVHNSDFQSNLANYGGAIANWEGTLNVSDSTFSSNESVSSGGGIFNYEGTANISGSLFHYNWSSGFILYPGGGAITNQGGTLNISNSTVTNNHCFHYRGPCFGGGVANTGQLNLRNSTIYQNLTISYPAPQGGGVANYSSGVMSFSNTIIAGNTGGDCLVGSILGNVNNLVADGSCNPALSGSPLLVSLQDNGGPTWTHALRSMSPAVDNGDEATCAAPPVNNLDQRGVTRPLDGDGDGTAACDIGAYEYDGPPPEKFYLPLIFHS